MAMSNSCLNVFIYGACYVCTNKNLIIIEINNKQEQKLCYFSKSRNFCLKFISIIKNKKIPINYLNLLYFKIAQIKANIVMRVYFYTFLIGSKTNINLEFIFI